MAEPTAIPRRIGAAARFIDKRLATGHATFPLADLVKETGLSMTAARNQLERLGNRVVRVCRLHRFFLIVSPEHAAMGAPPVEWWLDDYFKWLGHPYYLALQSAAAKFGSTPQALQVNQVMTDVPRREITVGRTRICFFVKCGIAHTPTESLPDAYAPLLISTPEATAFDLVRYAPRIGGIGRAAETLVPLLPLLRVAEMKRVLNTGNEVSTAQRLGYLLEKMGKEKVAEAIHDWVPARASLVPLIPAMGSRKTEAPIIARWRIVNNLGGVSL